MTLSEHLYAQPQMQNVPVADDTRGKLTGTRDLRLIGRRKGTIESSQVTGSPCSVAEP